MDRCWTGRVLRKQLIAVYFGNAICRKLFRVARALVRAGYPDRGVMGMPVRSSSTGAARGEVARPSAASTSCQSSRLVRYGEVCASTPGALPSGTREIA